MQLQIDVAHSVREIPTQRGESRYHRRTDAHIQSESESEGEGEGEREEEGERDS